MTLVQQIKTATIDVSADDDLSNEVDLGNNCDFLLVVLPALTSCQVSLQVALDEPTRSYQDLGDGVKTNTTTGAYSTTFKVGGYRYVKVKTSAAQAADRSIKMQGIKL